MSWLDIAIIFVLIAALVRGAIRGLIKEVFGLIGVILGIYLGLEVSQAIVSTLLEFGHSAQQVMAGRVLFFIIIFIIICVLVNLLGMLVSRAVRIASLGFADRILGAVLGFLEGFAFVAAILYLISNTSFGVKLITESLWGADVLNIVSVILTGFLGSSAKDLRQMLPVSPDGV